jgi:hypothetical protein
MKESVLQVLGGAALIGAGMFTAMFWILAADIGSFVGVSSVRHPLWTVSQWFHVLGALLTMFGLIALYAVHRERTGVAGLVGFALAIAGTVLFFADGFVALVIFPALAGAAPWVLSPTGAMNNGSVLAAFVLVAVVNVVGLTVFTLAMLHADLFPRSAFILRGRRAFQSAAGSYANAPAGPRRRPLGSRGGLVGAGRSSTCI